MARAGARVPKQEQWIKLRHKEVEDCLEGWRFYFKELVISNFQINHQLANNQIHSLTYQMKYFLSPEIISFHRKIIHKLSQTIISVICFSFCFTHRTAPIYADHFSTFMFLFCSVQPICSYRYTCLNSYQTDTDIYRPKMTNFRLFAYPILYKFQK